MSNFLSKNFIFFFLILFLSILSFRGRIGSDDLEVFNFVYNFKNFEGNLSEYLNALKNDESVFKFSDNIQKHTYYTWHHRFIWVIQTYIIYSAVDFFNLFFELDTVFFHKYFSGFILTFYSILSFFLCIKFYLNKNLNLYSSFLLSIYIFFSTGIITFLTGQYIESLVVLIIICRFYFKNTFIIFFLDFLIILIKPFYLLIVFSLKISEFNFTKIFKKDNLKILGNIGFLLLLFIIFRFTVTDVANNVAYVNSQSPNFNISNYFNNLFDFYFSHGSGIFFTLAPLVFLIFYGRDKKTKFKIYSIIFIGFVLSIYDGSHGGVSGGRYSIPFFMMFLEEYLRGYKKIYQEKKKILILISLITLLNLPSLEYRNFVISEYQNKTIITKKPLGPANIEKKNNEIKFVLYDWPINNLKFNNIIFSNLILYSKIFDNTYIEIDKDLILETNFIFPQTGIGRLIYINDKNMDSGHQFINKFANELNIYLKILYYLTAFIFLIFYFFCIYKVLKINNKYE